MENKIYLKEAYFAEKESTVLENATLSASIFKYSTGVLAVRLQNARGNLVLLHRMEDSLLASLEIAQNKAYTAVALKMPSAAVKELAKEGEELQGIAVTHAGKIVFFGGGFPIVKDGKQIGGIGVSGGSVAEDSSVAQAGLDAL